MRYVKINDFLQFQVIDEFYFGKVKGLWMKSDEIVDKKEWLLMQVCGNFPNA